MSRIYHFLRRTPIILPVFFDNRTTTISTQNNNTVQGILGTLTNEGVRISFVGKGSVWIIVETEELANRIGKLVFGILPDQIFKTSLISNKNNTTCYLVIISLQGEQLHMPTVQDREQELLKCLKETDAPLTFYSTNPLILFCTNENDSSKLAKILEEKTINLNTVEMYSDINKFIEDIDTSTYQVEEKQKQKNMVEEAPSTTHTNMTQEQQKNNMNALVAALNALNLNNPAWTYPDVVREIVQNEQDAMALAGFVINCINQQFGQYGSIHLGSKGGNYARLRLLFIDIFNNVIDIPNANLGNLVNLVDFLTEPLRTLARYGGGGPGGQGIDKINLNHAVTMTKERCHVVIGVLHLKGVLNIQNINWNAV